MSISSISAVTDSQNNLAALAREEANETYATTIIEAARGDQQAIRKLEKLQQQQQQMEPQNPTPTPEPGVGEAVNYSA